MSHAPINFFKLERAVRLELTYTGFAIRRLSRLATRAKWNGRRDSNSRVEFGRLACFQLNHFRMWNSRQDSNPHSRRSKRRALPIEPQEQNELVGEDRVELSPRVPKTRMLALHHTPI